MIQNNQELEAMLDRIGRFQEQVKKLQEVETNPHNYKLSAGGFLAEIDRMSLEVRTYLAIQGNNGIGVRITDYADYADFTDFYLPYGQSSLVKTIAWM